uniref:Myb/SANT-like DNA-binding domain-containing protein n=1 Tax=Salarias fasciatus TaxID=181472 RepID=A0A672GYZ3_SALFA
MSRGSTWGEEETKCLISIWSDDFVRSQLEKVHKNAETFQLFSERMKESGYERTGEQCHLKIKKLRQQYTKVRDALRKSGASAIEKDKFPFFEDLDSILSSRPTSSPVNVVENTVGGLFKIYVTNISYFNICANLFSFTDVHTFLSHCNSFQNPQEKQQL